ncbi:PTS sugar transporter subunit IIC, partial [Bacillus cereus]|nr:PTS sugar transporter subunit IIC [Bacillus cereus]
DWRAIVLVFINIAISFLIYLPFFKMYDKNMLEIEKNGDGESVNP